MKYESEYYDRGGKAETWELWEGFAMKQAYQTAKSAEIGTTCHCICGQAFTKKTKGQAFHGTKCKDRYWNTVDDKRRERAAFFN